MPSLKAKILAIPFLRHLWEMRLEPLRLIYKPEDLTDAYYEEARTTGDQELEHQVGRLRNFKKIIHEIREERLPGDLVEFGTWRGFSLHWLAYLCEREGMFDKRIIGIDGFVGLGESEGVFKRSQFANTSLESVRRNLQASTDLYDHTKKNIHVEKFLFSEKENILKRCNELGLKKFVFVHLDADLSSSTADTLTILSEGDLLADKAFLLFDDWGWDTELAAAVQKNFNASFSEWKIEEHSSTRYTKNFKLEKNK